MLLKNYEYISLKIFAINKFNICAYLQISDDGKFEIENALKDLGINKVVIDKKESGRK